MICFDKWFRRSRDSEILSTLGRRTLIAALNEIGKGELRANNGGRDVARYKGLSTIPEGNLGAWCASFVSWCIIQVANQNPPLGGDLDRWLRKRHGAKALYRMIGKAGSFVREPYGGDVVCWDRGKKGSWKGHIGIVESCNNGILKTVEGNVGRFPSVVQRLEHDLDRQPRIIGFARMP